MRWRIETKEINGKKWIVGCTLDSEKLFPEEPKHIAKPIKNLVDEHTHKPKYIFENNQIKEFKWKWSEQELKNRRKIIELRELRKQYSRDEEIEIHRHAIDKLALGEKLPAEYVEYRKVVDKAKQKAQDEIEELKNEI